MAKFELHYNHQAEYEHKVEVDIRLQVRPTQADYKDMLDAIDVLDKVAKKYVVIPQKEDKK